MPVAGGDVPEGKLGQRHRTEGPERKPIENAKGGLCPKSRPPPCPTTHQPAATSVPFLPSPFSSVPKLSSPFLGPPASVSTSIELASLLPELAHSVTASFPSTLLSSTTIPMTADQVQDDQKLAPQDVPADGELSFIHSYGCDCSRCCLAPDPSCVGSRPFYPSDSELSRWDRRRLCHVARRKVGLAWSICSVYEST